MAGQPWLHELLTVVGAPTVVLSEPGGQVRPGGAQGVLHADIRVLSQAVLEVAGAEPVPVGGGLLGAGTALFLSVPRNLGDGGADPAVRLERRREVTAGRVRERIRLISASGSAVGAPVALRVAADLAGIGDIKSGRAGEPARIEITRPARPGAGAGVPGNPGA
ncbi:MAG: amylo-alpha-1,6-glucosidase, partial [Actinobacteria bacterium]|nr:amylo-alpha-1,6-glucosidase [Actinomycetota bacterium]